MIETTGIRNVIFDLGDVLIEYRWRDMLRDYGLSAQEAERVGTEMFDDPLNTWHDYDLGAQTQDIIAAFRREYPEDGDVIEYFIRHGEYMVVPRPHVWAKVHELKERGFRIYLLSNYPEQLFDKHTEYADFMSDLDGKVISCELGYGKPEPRIYEYLLQRYQLNARESIFFDDRKENVTAAEGCGIRARQVLSKEGMMSDLERILRGEPLPEQAREERESRLL